MAAEPPSPSAAEADMPRPAASINMEELQGKRTGLRPTETVVTRVDGSQTIEADRGRTQLADPTGSGDKARGYIYDETMDYTLGEPIPHLFIGAVEAAEHYELLKKLNIGYILNAVDGLLNKFGDDSALSYHNVPLFDCEDQELAPYLEETNAFIEKGLQSGKGVLVHCMAGVSRSASLVCAYLIKTRKLTVDEAIELIRETRWVCPNSGFRKQLADYHKKLYP